MRYAPSYLKSVCLSAINNTVSRSRAFQPRPAAWVERLGDTTSRTLGLMPTRAVAVNPEAVSSMRCLRASFVPQQQLLGKIALF